MSTGDHWDSIIERAHDTAPTNNGSPSAFDARVSSQAERLHVRDAARALYEQEKAAMSPAEPFDIGTVTEILARPVQPEWRADGIIPANAGTLIVAQRKTGKTSVSLNLTRAVLTGEPFLGRFDTTTVTGSVAFLNYEVNGAQLARWATDAGVPGDRLHLVNLRGRRNPLAHPIDRQALAAQLKACHVEMLILDPVGRAFTGQSQNDAGEIGAFLSDLDTFARSEVGATDVILTAHAGWNGERTRGSSALEDWADSIITLTRDEDQQRRYIRAEGRDVQIDEDELTYDPITRSIRATGAGSRKQAAEHRHQAELLAEILPMLDRSPGMSGNAITKTLTDASVPFRKGDEIKALRAAVEAGSVTVEAGPRNAKLYRRTSPTSPDFPQGELTHLPHLPYREGGGGGGRSSQLINDTAGGTDTPRCSVCKEPMTFDAGSGLHATCEVAS